MIIAINILGSVHAMTSGRCRTCLALATRSLLYFAPAVAANGDEDYVVLRKGETATTQVRSVETSELGAEVEASQKV